MGALEQPSECRRSNRQPVTWPGTITYGADQISVACTIENISPNGLQVVIKKDQFLPEKFLITMPNGSKAFGCRIVWRDGPVLGVEFVDISSRLSNV